MPLIDIIVLLSTIIIVGLVIFFTFIYPKMKGKKSACSSCPSVKRAKRLVKDYHKENNLGD